MSRESYKAMERVKKIGAMSMADQRAYLESEKRHEPESDSADCAPRTCSAAAWYVYYLTDAGKTEYITGRPLDKYSAQCWQRAAQKYYRGRFVIQITETPPNDQAHPQPGAVVVERK